jgi:2-dehydro-3-deoxyglucarate aldolase/4-hydroxy-2-oxoheptanedioate aldolase
LGLPINQFKRDALVAAAGKGPIPIGTWIMSASPLLAEAMGCAGFDWLLVDAEHSPLDAMDVANMLAVIAGTGKQPIVRIPWNDPVLVKRAMDAGAQSLMFPMIQNADEARRAVAATRYPPRGIRGVAAMHRASRFGTVPDYLKLADAEVCVIAQIETPQAMNNLEAIAGVDGVDCLFVGPGDLSASMDLIGDIENEKVHAKLKQAATVCHKLGKPCGIVMGNPDAVSRCIGYGYTYVAVASDLGMIMARAREMLSALRPAANLPKVPGTVY